MKTIALLPLLMASSLVLVSSTGISWSQDGFRTSARPYISPTGEGSFSFRQLLTAGDIVPLTGSSTGKYRFVGASSGLGALPTTVGGKPALRMLVAHEGWSDSISEPIIGAPGFRGSFVSEYVLRPDGTIVSGGPAYDTVWNVNTLLGPAARTNNSTLAIGIFGGRLYGTDSGFDRPIYIASSLALFDRQLHTLPWLQSVVAVHPRQDKYFVAFINFPVWTIDEFQAPSYLFMFVGVKDPRPSQSVLRRNGLDNGRLFVLSSDIQVSEGNLPAGPVSCRWVPFSDAFLSGAPFWQQYDHWPLQYFAEYNSSAVRFNRITSGAPNHKNVNSVYFTTRDAAQDYPHFAPPNTDLGGLYELQLSADPREKCTLRKVYSARDVLAAGNDIALDPVKMEASQDYVVIAESSSFMTQPILDAKKRGESLWSLKISDGFSALREADIGGVSGILDVGGVINRPGAFLINAQNSTSIPTPPGNILGGGQISLMFTTDL